MRKLLFCAIVMAMSVMSNAQTLHETFTARDEVCFIPKLFSYDGKTGIVNVTDDNVANVYNEDIEFVRSFAINTAYGEVEYLDIRDFDDYAYNGKNVNFTQTLFNTDEKIEYVVCEADYNEYGFKVAGDYRIVSEDGRVLLTIPSDAGNLEYIYKINNKYYMIFSTREFINDKYSYKETFYRLDPQTTSISLVESMPVSPRSIHSLDGRKQSAMQRGVNIVRDEDGTTRKVLKD